MPKTSINANVRATLSMISANLVFFEVDRKRPVSRLNWGAFSRLMHRDRVGLVGSARHLHMVIELHHCLDQTIVHKNYAHCSCLNTRHTEKAKLNRRVPFKVIFINASRNRTNVLLDVVVDRKLAGARRPSQAFRVGMPSSLWPLLLCRCRQVPSFPGVIGASYSAGANGRPSKNIGKRLPHPL